MIVDKSALGEGYGTPAWQKAANEYMRYFFEDLRQAEAGLKQFPDSGFYKASKERALERIKDAKDKFSPLTVIKREAEKFGLPVEVYPSGKAMHAEKVLSALERKKR